MICVCYLGHLWPQVDLFQVNGLRQQVVEQLAEQHTISQSLSQVTHLEQAHKHTHTHKIKNQKPQYVLMYRCVNISGTAHLPVHLPM